VSYPWLSKPTAPAARERTQLPIQPRPAQGCELPPALSLPCHDLPDPRQWRSPTRLHAVPCFNDSAARQQRHDDHHIFPAKFLDDLGIDSFAIATACSNALLNRQCHNQAHQRQCPFNHTWQNCATNPRFPMRAVLRQPLIPIGRSQGCERRLQAIPEQRLRAHCLSQSAELEA